MNAEFLTLLIRSALTLYMMAILLRWLGPWIEVDMNQPALRWTVRLTDPLVNLMRRVLPPMGPMDWGPVAALMAVWILRIITTGA